MRSTGILASSSWGLITLTAALCAQGTSLDKTWPDYRGPRRDGHAPQAQIPLRWSEEKNVRWKTPIHGKGWSSPVVWGDRVWLSSATADGHQNHVIAIDLKTGKTIIDRQLFQMSHFTEPGIVNQRSHRLVDIANYFLQCGRQSIEVSQI